MPHQYNISKGLLLLPPLLLLVVVTFLVESKNFSSNYMRRNFRSEQKNVIIPKNNIRKVAESDINNNNYYYYDFEQNNNDNVAIAYEASMYETMDINCISRNRATFEIECGPGGQVEVVQDDFDMGYSPCTKLNEWTLSCSRHPLLLDNAVKQAQVQFQCIGSTASALQATVKLMRSYADCSDTPLGAANYRRTLMINFILCGNDNALSRPVENLYCDDAEGFMGGCRTFETCEDKFGQWCTNGEVLETITMQVQNAQFQQSCVHDPSAAAIVVVVDNDTNNNNENNNDSFNGHSSDGNDHEMTNSLDEIDSTVIDEVETDNQDDSTDNQDNSNKKKQWTSKNQK